MVDNGYVAERRLFFTTIDGEEKDEVCFRISYPYSVDQSQVSFDVGTGVYGCRVEVIGLDVKAHEVYGVDSVQALNMASDLEPLIKRLSKRYKFYWQDGEPYFENISEK